jgi:hypothetical protein
MGLGMNEAQLFTVRVWRQSEQFRASVRAVGEERVHLFTAPAPLAAFLFDAADHSTQRDKPCPEQPDRG